MKIGNIVSSNSKGQIVIPKQIRKAVGISAETPLNIVIRGNGIYIYPIHDVISNSQGENIYSKILDRTRGSWRTEDKEDTQEERMKVELIDSQKNKQAW